eukprot:24827-Chlamydomonas_euryale.AAC.1
MREDPQRLGLRTAECVRIRRGLGSPASGRVGGRPGCATGGGGKRDRRVVGRARAASGASAGGVGLEPSLPLPAKPAAVPPRAHTPVPVRVGQLRSLARPAPLRLLRWQP